MQLLSKVHCGATCTIKWMLGLPDIVTDYMHSLQVKQGSEIQVIQNSGNYLIINSSGKRIALDSATAAKIHV